MGLKNGIKNLIVYGSAVAIIGSGFCFGLNRASSEVETVGNFSYEDFDIAAHRGFSSIAVENTSWSFDLASQAPYVDYIEMDARLTEDGKLVLAHDDIVVAPFYKNNISDMTYDDVTSKSFTYYSDDLKIYFDNLFGQDGKTIINRLSGLNGITYNVIGLEDGIDDCGEKKILLDLKFDENVVKFLEALEDIFDLKDTSNIVFQSDDAQALLYLKTIHPEWFCSVLVRNSDDLELVEYFDGIGIRKDIVDDEFVKDVLKDGKLVSVWTFRSINEVNKVATELGNMCNEVLYITDYPDLVFKHLVKNYNDK